MKKALLRSAVALGLSGSAHAQVSQYFKETFATPGTALYAYNNASIGWLAYAGPTATDRSANTFTAGNDGLFITGAVASAGPDGISGIAAKTSQNGGSVALIYTAEFAPVATTELSSFSFLTRNAVAVDTQRVAIQIGDNWYASTQTFSNAGAAATWTTQTLSFVTDASAWQSLSFAAGSTLALGSVLTDSLPVGTLTAAGLFTDANSNTLRMDDFTINTASIPEPSTYAALAGTAALALVALRRRRAAA